MSVRNDHQLLTRNISLVAVQLHGRRQHAGCDLPQRPLPAVDVHAGHREPLQHPDPSGRRREPSLQRPVGDLRPAAGVAALLPLTTSGGRDEGRYLVLARTALAYYVFVRG